MSPEEAVRRWRRASEPVGAHALAEALLGPRRYAHSRGVAQQAARLARACHLARADRGRLLATAWLHDVGHALGGFHPVSGARALRRGGHERMARIVAHHSGAAMQAALMGLPPVAAEFPAPRGHDAVLLRLVDIADLTTTPDGAPTTPAGRLRDLVGRGSFPGPEVRVLVAAVTRMGDDPEARRLVELVAPRSPA